MFKKGTILEKSDQDLMTEFIRGLPTPNRFHILTQGTDTFNNATRIATLFETTQTFGQDDSAVTLQQQGTSVKEQNFNIVDSSVTTGSTTTTGTTPLQCTVDQNTAQPTTERTH